MLCNRQIGGMLLERIQAYEIQFEFNMTIDRERKITSENRTSFSLKNSIKFILCALIVSSSAVECVTQIVEFQKSILMTSLAAPILCST